MSVEERQEDLALKYKPRVIPTRADSLGPGIYRWDVDGARVILPMFCSDPTKANEQYLDNQRAGTTIDGFNREILCSFESWGGKRVFPEFNEGLHEADRALSYDPSLPIVVGVDVPGPAAAIWCQLFPVTSHKHGVQGYRLHVLLELLLEDETIANFGDAILSIGAMRFPEAKHYIYVADPAAFDNLNGDKRTAADILMQMNGIRMIPGPRNITARLDPIREWLRRTVPVKNAGDKAGAMLVDPDCKLILDAFRGGYHYKSISSTGRYREIPEKNCESSHVMDGLAYAVWYVQEMLKRKKKAKESAKPLKWGRVVGAFD